MVVFLKILFFFFSFFEIQFLKILINTLENIFQFLLRKVTILLDLM